MTQPNIPTVYQYGEESRFVFDATGLKKCVISGDALDAFRIEAVQQTFKDDDTGGLVVVYLHPDGRFLIDKILIPR